MSRQTMKRYLKWMANGVALSMMLTACSPEAKVPETFTPLQEEATLYPDYTNVTIPANIAPLNVRVEDETANEFVMKITGKTGELLCSASEDGKMKMDSTTWHQLTELNRGETLTVELYAHRVNGWVRYAPYKIQVAQEDIDGFLSYRLIEPGYELYRQLGLYQRNLSNFEVTPIYENNRVYDDENNHCINCHNYQAYDTERMLFHVRGSHGGTLIAQGTEVKKIGIKHDSILSAGVYPSWHPTLPLVAFSTNKTGQAFHMKHAEKIEVVDEASDLLLYDAEKNTVQNVLKGWNAMETFPCWNPTGDTLYYCQAETPHLITMADSLRTSYLLSHYDSVRYNVMCMPFDVTTRTFGTPRMVINCADDEESASVPRVSPDGRYVLYTRGDYGQFHIWHRSADLWVKDLQTGEDRALKATNAANQPDSYHTWSSNGRWIVFASRRLDGNFSRVFIAYFDTNGQAHKAFLLPQEDPEYNVLLLKSFNVPELTRSAVKVSKDKFHQVIYNTKSTPAKFMSR